MDDNYKSWDIDVEEFDNLISENEKIKFFLKFAVLAPSSHNTQPWAFKVDKGIVYVYRELSRRLKVADTNDRQLFLSLGCAIENIIVAADYFGYTAKVEYNNDSSNAHLAAKIEFSNSKPKFREGKNHLIFSILTRKTNRNKYRKELIDSKILEYIKNLENEKTKIIITDNQVQLTKLAEIAVTASVESMVDNSFRHELSKHLKHNLTKSKIGMPGFSLGIPTPISFLLPQLMRRFNLEKASEKQNLDLLKNHTPYIVIIATEADDKSSWLDAGLVFQHIALITNQHGISLSPWGAPIQIGLYYKNIQEALNIKERPQMFFRMGFPVKGTKLSPRLSLDEVMK